MNRDLLEQLLMDQVLNELSPESAALLDAYMADHPEMQSLADSIREAVAIGEKALHAELPTSLPPLPKEKLLSRSRLIPWSVTSRWMSVAASLIIGFGIGISAKLLQNEPSQTYPGAMASYVQSQSVSDGLETAQAFWSSKTYIDRYEKNSKGRIQRNENTQLQKQIPKFKKRGLL
jgi:anti-sigma factor RsiW